MGVGEGASVSGAVVGDAAGLPTASPLDLVAVVVVCCATTSAISFVVESTSDGAVADLGREDLRYRRCGVTLAGVSPLAELADA